MVLHFVASYCSIEELLNHMLGASELGYQVQQELDLDSFVYD